MLKDGKYGFINNLGEVVVPIQYDEIEEFGKKNITWALVKKDGFYGYIDSYGQEIIPTEFESEKEINIISY